METRCFGFLVWLWVFCCSVPAQAQELRIVTAEYAPFALLDGALPDGFCVSIVREIQQRVGNRSAIEVFPWARAYRLAGTGPGVLLVCPERTPWRESYLKWVGPVYASRTRLYAKRSNPPAIRTLDDAGRLAGILVPRESHAMEFLHGIGFTNVEAVASAKTMLRMLMAGRRPAMLIEERQLAALLRDEHVDPGQLVPVYTVFTAAVYLGFSAKTPDEEVRRWDMALLAMKADGTFAHIYRKWFGEAPPRELLH